MALIELESLTKNHIFGFSLENINAPGFSVRPNSFPLPPERYSEIRKSIEVALHDRSKNIEAIASADFDKCLIRNWDKIFYDLNAFDASQPGTWSFLTLRVLFDFALLRFPNNASERYLGRPRNVFWRLYQRQSVFGSDLAAELLEDEAVQILERTSLIGSSREVARSIASAIVRQRNDVKRKIDLSKAVRETIKKLRREFSIVAFASMDPTEIDLTVSDFLKEALGNLEEVG